MTPQDQDITDRLYNATPYGLEDCYLLIDARREILRLRAELGKHTPTTERDTP